MIKDKKKYKKKLLKIIVGPKDLRTPTHLISSPRPTSRSKKCPRTDGENPDLQVVRPRTIGRP